jgi:hypothetical protein
VLLEVSDYISNVLYKVDQLIPADVFGEPLSASTPIFAPLKDSEHQTARTRTRARSAGRSNDPSAIALGKRFESAEMATTATPLVAAQQAAQVNDNPSVVSAVYALRRGGTRQETLTAVENLIQLCNFGGELCLPAVKQMLAAGTFCALVCVTWQLFDNKCAHHRSTAISVVHAATCCRLAGSGKANFKSAVHPGDI